MMKFVCSLFVISFSLVPCMMGNTEKVLSGKCTESMLYEKLVPYEKFAPVPVYGDSYWRDSIPEEMKASYIKNAEKYIGTEWESIKISLFSEFRENGNRDRYQKFLFTKRNKLMALAMGEVMEGKGRFMDDILDGMFSVCEETWWGVPAHYGTNMPVVERQNLDLFNAETAGMMAWMYYMFKKQIAGFSPLLDRRIKDEISRRVLEEAVRRKEWWRTAAMNWNPWICSNWMACVLLVEDDRDKQVEYMNLILESLDAFIDGYPDDGGCDEGAHYWDRAAGSLYDCLVLLKKATGGEADFADNGKIRLMGDYLAKMNIGNGYFVNFADAGPGLTPRVEWFPSALYADNKELASMTVKTALDKGYFKDPAALYTASHLYTFNRELMLLSELGKFRNATGKNVLPFDSWLPRIQVITARSRKNSEKGLYLAAKGGHNAESHNHNDVGSFIVYADSYPLFIDPGVGTYTRETFNNATRYKIWSMQSGYHNLPKINGKDQSFGKKYAAADVKADISSGKVVFSLDISGAYPDEAHVDKWTRTVRFVRDKYIKVTEEYRLDKYTAPSEIVLMSPNKPILKDGVVKYGVHGTEYGVFYDAKKLKPVVEEVKLDDSKFVAMWGRLYRLRLVSVSDKLSGKIEYTIKEM